MKRLFTRLLLLVFLVFTLNYLYTEYFPYYYMDKGYVLFRLKRDLSRKYNPTITTVIIGDSYPTAGIISKNIKNSYNFSLPGGSAIEAYYTLKRLFENKNNIQTVFLSLAPHHLEGYSCEFWEEPVLNFFYNNEEILDIISHSDSLKDYSAIGTHPYLSLLKHNLHLQKELQPKFIKSFLVFNKKSNIKMKRQLEENLGQNYLGMDSCNTKTYTYLPSEFAPKLIYDFYFYKIMDICHEKNVRLIYETMPMKPQQLDITKPNYLKQYLSFLNKAQLKYPKHVISDTLFSFEYCLFGDKMHLNNKGAHIYTNYLMKKIFLIILLIHGYQSKLICYPKLICGFLYSSIQAHEFELFPCFSF